MAIMRQFKPGQLRSGSYNISGSFSGSFQGDGTKVLGVITSSYAQNADLLDGRDSTTYANTGSNVFVGQQVITGSVFVTGSQTINGNLNVSNNIITSGSSIFGDSTTDTHQFTGSLLVTSSHISTVDYIDFNSNLQTDPAFNTGRIHWVDDTKTLGLDTDVNGSVIELGHQHVVRVTNLTNATIVQGSVVFITGSQGTRPGIATASYTDENNSATTLGIVMHNIVSTGGNSNGYVVTKGIIRGVNTSGFAAGSSLYLSSSGQYTTVKPQAPLHDVRLGKVIVGNSTNAGVIYVDIQNGYEIDELHNVRIISPNLGDLLINSGSLWINTKQLSGSYAITGSLNVTSATGSFTGSFIGNGSGLFSGSFSGSISSNLQEVTDNGSATTNSITASGIQTNDFHLIGNGTVTGSFIISGSNTFKNIGPAQFTGSVNITGSGILNGTPLVTEAVYNPFTASYYQDSASFDTRILNNSSSIALLSGSYLNSSSSFDTRILNNSSSIALLSGSYLLDSASFSSRVTTNENSIASLTFKTGSYATTGSNTFTGNQIIDGNITVNGTASVALLYTTYQTSSIIFSSGSTKFGDTLDDTHQFTGSVTITGSDFKWNGDTVLTVTPFNNFTSSYLQDSSSFNSRISNNSSSIAILSGSYLNSSASFDTRILNNSSSISSLSGSYLNSSASFDTRILNNSSSIALLSSSYEAFTDTYNTGSFTGSFIGSLFGTASWATNALSASFITASNIFGPYGSNSVISASYALTASYALNGGTGTIDTGSLLTTASSALNVITFTKGDGSTFPITINTGSGGTANTASLLTTASISGNTITFTKGDGSTFPIVVPSSGGGSGSSFPYTGSAIITGSLIVTGSTTLYSPTTQTLTLYGSGSTEPIFLVTGSQGELFSITDNLSGSLFAVTTNIGLPILDVNSDNRILFGDYLAQALLTTTKVTTVTGSNIIYSFASGSYDGAWFEYTARSGSNLRTGQIMAAWYGSTINYTETTTNDIGSTAALGLTVIITGSNIAFTGSTSTAGWNIKTIIRSI
jgi:hypothetical protein